MTEPAAASPTPERSAEIAANLRDYRARVDAACKEAGRSPAELTLIAVTKTFPASDVVALAGLGITDVGENRDQEADPKHEACAALPLRWHFVGQLQTRKCRSVASYSDVVHSVDRARLVDALGTAARGSGRTITALIQVSLDPEAAGAGRGGAAPADVPALADRLAGAEGLVLGGLMAVAPLGEEPDAAFARLQAVAEALRATHPAATTVSAGMSGDFEAAIRHGATHLRVGTALLGGRPQVFR